MDTLVVLPFSSSNIYGVPSTVILSNKAMVKNVWRGLLHEFQEEEVLSTLGLILNENGAGFPTLQKP